MANKLDTLVFGYGIVYGAEIHLSESYTLEVSAGGVVLSSGEIVHFPRKTFPNYKKASETEETVTAMLSIQEAFELTDEHYDSMTMDSFKEQHPGDFPAYDFLLDKILVLYVPTAALEKTEALQFFLVSRDELAKARGIRPSVTASGGIFGKALKTASFDVRDIENWLFPDLRLPVLRIRRLGYQKNGIISQPIGLTDENIQNPFTPEPTQGGGAAAIGKSNPNSYRSIFFEFKAILDENLHAFQDILENLHEHFGAFLTHRHSHYLEQFRKVLIAKWQHFLEEGEHLYYIQYFYDWLVDLVKAYDELTTQLTGFTRARLLGRSEQNGAAASILLLGPALEGRTTYHLPIFRQTIEAPLTDQKIREIRLLHWRLLMMIWTFDLPFLQLDKVLYRFGFEPGQEELLDSTNYWEWIDKNGDGNVDIEDLPIKITPTNPPFSTLGQQAIPYYYPIDSDSEYSVHQFWDYTKNRKRQIDWHLSYNAHPDDKDQLGTEVENDSYSDRKEVLTPLAFNLREYPFLKLEGHIGKKIITEETSKSFTIKSFPLAEYIAKYNLSLEVVAIKLPKNGAYLQELLGLEHRSAMEPAQTMVFLFVNYGNMDQTGEQIEFTECKKDDTPEVFNNVILADFILPYRISTSGDATQFYALAKNS